MFKNNHSENGTRYFEEIRRTEKKTHILQIGTFRFRTDRSGWPVSLTNGKRHEIHKRPSFNKEFASLRIMWTNGRGCRRVTITAFD